MSVMCLAAAWERGLMSVMGFPAAHGREVKVDKCAPCSPWERRVKLINVLPAAHGREENVVNVLPAAHGRRVNVVNVLPPGWGEEVGYPAYWSLYPWWPYYPGIYNPARLPGWI